MNDLPDPEKFHSTRRALHTAVKRALDALRLGLYFPDLDLTIQIRGGKIVRTDWREMDTGN